MSSDSKFPILSTRVEFNDRCDVCDNDCALFVFGWYSAQGLIGCCIGCGDPKLAPWTRATVEAA